VANSSKAWGASVELQKKEEEESWQREKREKGEREREREREKERERFFITIIYWVATVLPNTVGSTVATQGWSPKIRQLL
jgi:hypothetical protein